jgi:SOS-response transcriptional repressor LexA
MFNAGSASMKSGVINKEVNGWPIIAKWLVINDKRQTDLASLLNVTASAISQIKSGTILLNAKQIRSILDYLNIDSHDMCAMFTLIFNARLNNIVGSKHKQDEKLIVNIADLNKALDFSILSEVEDSSSEYKGCFRRVPLITVKQALNFQPALETIESFARCCSGETVVFSNVSQGSFALLVEHENCTPEFKHSAILLVAGDEYPADGDMVVAKLRSGQVITKYYFREEDKIHLKSKELGGDNFTWNYHRDPGYIQWIYPIIEASLKLRADSYKVND